MHWPQSTSLRFLLSRRRTLLHRAPGVNLPFKVINNYGPTECTVVATSGMVGPKIHLILTDWAAHARIVPPSPCATKTARLRQRDRSEKSASGAAESGEATAISLNFGRALGSRSSAAAFSTKSSPLPLGDLGRRCRWSNRIPRPLRLPGKDPGAKDRAREMSQVLYRHPKVKFATVKHSRLNRAIAPCRLRGSRRTKRAHLDRTSGVLLEHLARLHGALSICTLGLHSLSPNGKIDRQSLRPPGLRTFYPQLTPPPRRPRR